MNCPKCGNNVQESSKFCTNCGEKLENTQQENNSTSAYIVTNNADSEWQSVKIDPSNYSSAQNSGAASNAQKSKKFSQNKKIIIAFSAIILVIVAIIIGVSIGKKTNKEQSLTDVSQTAPTEQFKVVLKVKSISNVLFSTYDLKVFVDDKEQGEFANGKNDTYTLTLEKGEHILMICSSDDASVKGEYLFNVEKAEKLQFELYSRSDEIEIKTVDFEEETEEDTSSQKTTTEKDDSTYYSTNDYKTATNGNSGIFSYRSRGGQYQNYWIIDFDAGFVYWFSDGNGNEDCDRIKIESGTLNDTLIITYHTDDATWSYGLHFKYKGSPEHLIVEDNDGFELDYYPTDLDAALKIKEQKNIINF